jgi:hypothetical protein
MLCAGPSICFEASSSSNETSGVWKMRKHVIAAAMMFGIATMATGAIVAGTGEAVAAETGTKTLPTSSVNPPPTPPPVWGDKPRGHYVYPRHVYYPRHHHHHHYCYLPSGKCGNNHRVVN